MAQHIKNFFAPIIPHYKVWKINLIENWNTIVGDLHEHVTLINIQNNMLLLGVYDSTWLQELYILSPVLLKTINDYLGDEHITRLRFKNIGYKKNKKNLHEKKIVEKKIKKPHLTTRERTILTSIHDSELRNELERYLIRCKEKE